MAGIKISALPVLPSSAFADVAPFVQGGTTYQGSNLQVATLFGFDSTTHLLAMSKGGTNANLTAALGAIPYSTASAFAFLAPGTSGQLFQSGGAGAPVWTTATFPAVGGAAGNILISDGTNYIASTSLWPNTVGTAGKILRSDGTTNAYTTSTFADTYAVSTLLYASSSNTVAGLATANDGLLVTSNTGVPSILAGPGTTGNILQSNAAAAPSFSTATFPSTAGSSGNVLVSNGTNWSSSATTSITALGAQAQALNMNTHLINGVVDPVSAQDAATKNYVDQTALNGTSVYAASAATLGTVTQSGSSVGATLTNAGAQATFALDGVNPPVGSNVLIKDTATGMTAANEGIYTVTSVGSIITNWVLTRATEYDTPTEINNTGLILVQNGSTLIGTAWYNAATIVTVDTTSFSYSQFGNITFPISLAHGGTNANLTAANGAIPYSTASAFAFLAPGTSGQLFQSGGAGAPNWTTATFPTTAGTAGNVMSSDGTNFISNNAISIGASAASGSLVISATNGYITNPKNPSFDAYVTTTSAAVTGDTTAYVISSFTTNYDVTSSFNASTGIFTAPVTGYYMFAASVALGSLGAGNTVGIAYFQGGSLSGGAQNFDQSNWAVRRQSGTNILVLIGSIVIKMNASATMKVAIMESNNGSKNVTVIGGAGNTNFSGILIG